MNSQVICEISPEGTSGLQRVGSMEMKIWLLRREWNSAHCSCIEYSTTCITNHTIIQHLHYDIQYLSDSLKIPVKQKWVKNITWSGGMLRAITRRPFKERVARWNKCSAHNEKHTSSRLPFKTQPIYWMSCVRISGAKADQQRCFICIFRQEPSQNNTIQYNNL